MYALKSVPYLRYSLSVFQPVDGGSGGAASLALEEDALVSPSDGHCLEAPGLEEQLPLAAGSGKSTTATTATHETFANPGPPGLKQNKTRVLGRKETWSSLYVHTNQQRLIRDGGSWGAGSFISNTNSLHCLHQNDSALRWAAV